MIAAVEIAANLARVREQIALAAARAGRPAQEIRLLAVTKTFPAETVRTAYECGLREFGENRVQELGEKVLQLRLPDARFHLIGHLQSNKVGPAMLCDCIQTVDSGRLAGRLNDAAAKAGKKLSVLIQVKLEGEGREAPRDRSGAAESEVDGLVELVAAQQSLELRGLMVLPPFTPDPQGARPYFRRLRALRDRLRNAGFPQMEELSMGMTHDFPVAIEEGSTMVRIGTALFGLRPAVPAEQAGP